VTGQIYYDLDDVSNDIIVCVYKHVVIYIFQCVPMKVILILVVLGAIVLAKVI